jgi:quinol monooxygenase YgiN
MEDKMAENEYSSHEIRQLARYQVRPESVRRVLAAINEFVTYVRTHEPGTLRYDVWQEQNDPTRFVHIFVFRDESAHHVHSSSREVEKFSSILYPECLAPVEFIDYQFVVSNTGIKV